MFILASLNKLVDPEPEIRMFALKLLGVIGTEQEIGPIIVMLSDEENEVSYAAAVALAAIGNERTVIAFDLWIKSPSNKAKVSKLKDMKQCREELRVRLDKEKAMKIKP